MRKYIVEKEFWKGGRRRVVGDPIQLTDSEARSLKRAGKVSAVEQPKKKAAPKAKEGE